MPPNHHQLPSLIQQAVRIVPDIQKDTKEKTARAYELWQKARDDQEKLAALVNHFINKEDRLYRCAGPADEDIAAQFPPTPITSHTVLVCADGSEKYPDNHQGIQWGLVNTATVTLSLWPDIIEMPSIRVETEFFLGDARITPGGLILTEESVDLFRDLRERELLAECACDIDDDHFVVAAIDGKLELYGSRDSQLAGEFSKSLQRCKQVFQRLREKGRFYMGYVESQHSDLLPRLLEVSMTSSARERSMIRKQHPLAGVTDMNLFNHFLKPGYRSAVFDLLTRATGAFEDSLAVCFFFLNVGDEKHPHTIRVEIPKFYAHQTEVIARIQTVLYSQCHILPERCYPYGLTRADELARISLSDHKAIQAQLMRAYLDAGLLIPANSAKTESKSLT